MRQEKIIIIDDESSLRLALFRMLEKNGYQVLTASNKQEALMYSKMDQSINLAIIDLILPDGNGIDLMKEMQSQHPGLKSILISGQGSVDLAVKGLQSGALHFLTKPINMEQLSTFVFNALTVTPQDLKQITIPQQEISSKKFKFGNIIGESESIKSVLDIVSKVAEAESTVLVTGESGTGKELIARAIHNNSLREHGPFIAINCGAIPAELLESELFGHVKGAFTGAIKDRIGRFELANEGTLFLDEIGDLHPSLQVKLLRVLQEKTIEPVGGTKSIHVNVRVIAATNKTLEDSLAEGTFREDLYYRLNVIPILVPPLRERKTDISILLSHFINQSNKGKTKQLTGISSEALDCLINYPWPGNIRELENLIERISIMKGAGLIELMDIPIKYRSLLSSLLVHTEDFKLEIPDNGMDFNSAVDKYENALILRALEKTGWNRNQAALLLRLNRTTLVEKIKKKGLRPPNDMMTDLSQ